MSSLLLQTKLRVPPVRPDLVPRHRLVERLNAGFHRRLSLISAPAGFGKTSLLGEWSQQSEHPIAWLSLDREDNDPSRFWAYVVAALRLIQPDVGGAVLAASPHPIPIEPIRANLIEPANPHASEEE